MQCASSITNKANFVGYGLQDGLKNSGFDNRSERNDESIQLVRQKGGLCLPIELGGIR